MTHEISYQTVVGVRLIPGQVFACGNGIAKLPWSEMHEEEETISPSILMIDPRIVPTRQACQGLPEVMQPAEAFEPEMVLVPAGEFTMGGDPSLDLAAIYDEHIQHALYLPDYYLAKRPVTNTQYAAFVQATGYRPPRHWIDGRPPSGKESHPVVYVSWHDAMAYCRWLAEETGKPYHLPSEVEWEKAAQASDGRTRFHGGSPYDLLDMAGSVWEWTQSVYQVYPYDPKDGLEDVKSGVSRVLRGGSWYGHQWYARCTLRYRVYADARYHYIGFRVAAPPALLRASTSKSDPHFWLQRTLCPLPLQRP